MMRYVVLVALALSGCAVGPDYETPDWRGPLAWMGVGEGITSGEQVVGDLTWWKAFNDPVLDQLVTLAIDNNGDLRVARARVLEARAARTSANAELLPLVTAGASVTRGDTTGTLNTNKLMSVDASWEVDLLGGNRRAAEAAGYSVQAVDAARRYVVVSLLADVVRGYMNLRDTQQQVAITENNLNIQRETARIVRAQQTEGVASDFDVSRAEAQRLGTEVRMTAARQSLAVARNTLAVLVGISPADVQARTAEVKPVPVATPNVVVAKPAYVIAVRPDVQQAERALAAATATQGVAAASWFPKLSLTSLFGIADTSTRSSDAVWQAGGSVIAPVLDFGRVRAAVKTADARQMAALATYEQAINRALADVETALTGYVSAQRQLVDLREAAVASRRASDLADMRYKEGVSSLLDVLTVQEQKLAAESALSNGEAAVGIALANLYTAIGGGAEAANTPNN